MRERKKLIFKEPSDYVEVRTDEQKKGNEQESCSLLNSSSLEEFANLIPKILFLLCLIFVAMSSFGEKE